MFTDMKAGKIPEEDGDTYMDYLKGERRMGRFGKKGLIAGILALGFVLAGTSYAEWTDQNTIESKVATGDLDIAFVDLGLYAQYGDEDHGWSIVSSNDGTGIPKNGKEIGIKINKIYPGYAQAFRTDIINKGSIAAKLKNIKVEVPNKNEKILSSLGMALYIEEETYKPIHSSEVVFALAKNFNKEDVFDVGGVGFVRLSALEKADFSKILEKKKVVCKTADPNRGRMDMFLGVAMDSDFFESDLSNEGSFELSLRMLWDQFNAQ